MSQSQLARAIGVSQATIQKIEAGETMQSRYLAQIWAHLQLPLSELDDVFAGLTAPNPDPSAVSSAFDPNSNNEIKRFTVADFVEFARLSMAQTQQPFELLDFTIGEATSPRRREGVMVRLIRPDRTMVHVGMSREQARRLAQALADAAARDQTATSPKDPT
jgi:transcriptional regulator with XRE-family HTH domain